VGAAGKSGAAPASSAHPAAGAGRNFWLWAAAVFLAAAAFYIKSAAPDFLFDDNPEFIAASYGLGIAHPPGYPLLSLIGKLFSYTAPGASGFPVNLLSAFTGAAAIALAFLLLMRATGWLAPSLLGAGMMLTARLYWEQAGQADLYALNGLFLFATLHILWSLDGSRRDAPRLTALSAVFLLALFNHYTMVLVFPVYVVYIFWLRRRQLDSLARMIPAVVFAAAVSYSVLMYLPLRSAANPAMNWDDQTTITGFVKHVKGVDLRSETPRVPLQVKWRFVEDYAKRLWHDRSPFLLLLLPPGLWSVLKRGGAFGRRRGALLIAVWFFLFAGYVMLPNYLYGPRASYVVKSFHCTSLLMLGFLMGFGADKALGFLRRARLPWGAVAAAVALLIGYSALTGRTTADHSSDLLAPRYGRNMLQTASRDAVIFSTLETETFPMINLRAVHLLRRDTTIHGRHGDPLIAALAISRREQTDIRINEVDDIQKYALASTIFQRPVFFTKRLDIQDNPSLVVVTNGLLYMLAFGGKPLYRPDPWIQIDQTGLNYRFKEYDMIQKGVLSRYLILHGEHYLELGRWDAAMGCFNRAAAFNPGSRFLRANLGGIFLRISDFRRAREEYEKGLAADPENVETSIDTVAMYSNLSFIYGTLGENKKAVVAMETAVRLDPKNGLLRVNLGKTYWHLDRCADTVQQLEASIRLGIENNAAVYNILGICYEKLGAYKKAGMNYERALTTNPALTDAYRDYGVFNAYIMNRPEKAVELLNTYLELSPGVRDEPEIRVNLGFLNKGLGKYEAAISSFRIAILLGADTTPRKAAIINNALADCLDKAGRPQEAADAYEKGLTGANDYPKILVDYADFLDRRNKNPAYALKLLDRYLAVSPIPEDNIRVDLITAKLKSKMKR
jgi:tetratricopeptide (TPR) repeat protein